MIRSERIPVADLVIDPVQAREEAWSNDEADRQLAASVAEEGLLQDLIVRPLEHVTAGDAGGNSASYAIVAGSRRYHAAMDAGLEAVPCKVLDADDLDAAWTSLLENTDRKDLSEQEIAQQLALIYELVRPRQEPAACPQCGVSVSDGPALDTHYEQTDCTPRADRRTAPSGLEREGEEGETPVQFTTEYQAKRYLAQRFLGRTDDSAITLVEGHLRTAALPDSLQALFKSPADRTASERQTLENYGIETETMLGSGEGKSGTSREIVALHETVQTDLADDAVTATDAVLETVGSLAHPEMSEQELRRTLREFRHDVTSDVASDDAASEQRQQFRETLQRCAEDLRETYEEVEPQRPFKKVDVLGPETQHHSRWHARVKASRDVSGHGELVRELYQERLEALAEAEGWE